VEKGKKEFMALSFFTMEREQRTWGKRKENVLYLTLAGKKRRDLSLSAEEKTTGEEGRGKRGGRRVRLGIHPKGGRSDTILFLFSKKKGKAGEKGFYSPSERRKKKRDLSLSKEKKKKKKTQNLLVEKKGREKGKKKKRSLLSFLQEREKKRSREGRTEKRSKKEGEGGKGKSAIVDFPPGGKNRLPREMGKKGGEKAF